MSRDDGGSAFPFDKNVQFPGASMRDYFAAAALQGMNANPELMETVTKAEWWKSNRELWFSKMSETAYQQADAMLKERSKS